jgi:molybdopterin synthase catalytic subunit
MLVNVRLFAVLRERAGTSQIELELPDGAHVADALAALSDLAGDLPLVMAINRDYADADATLSPGDELALIPPVSGGGEASCGEASVTVRLVDEPLAPERLTASVGDPRAGAIVSFLGVTREVERLDYEAYEEMAVEQLRAIAADAVARHGLCKAAVEHRVGTVPLGEPSVAVVVSAPHRDAAFAGAREIIDEVKARAAIWKRETEGGESRWVAGAKPAR